MGKDFFEVLASYDPVKEVVPLALKKFDLDIARDKLNLEERVFQENIKLKADEALRVNNARERLANIIKTGVVDKVFPEPPDEGAGVVVEERRRDLTPKELALKSLEGGIGKPEDILKLYGAFSAEKPEQFAASAGRVYSKSTGQVVSEAPGKPQKTVERTVDLGNVVRYHYTDGTVEDVKKGLAPSQENPKAAQDFDTFERLYPKFKGQQGTPAYTAAFNDWWKNRTKTTFYERISTGAEQVGTPEQRESDVRAVMNNQTTLDELSRQGGLGGIGGAYARTIRTEVLKRNPNFNFVLQKMMVSGDTTEIKQLQGMRGKILSFEKTAIQNAKQVHLLASKIDVSKIPLINDLILKGETSLAGDKVASNYMLAWRTFVNEYARVSTSATGGGITSDTARKEMEDAIKRSNTPEMIRANMRQAVLEMEHRRYGFDKQSEEIYDRWGGREGFAATLPTPESVHKIFSTPTPSVTEEKPGRTEVERRKTKSGKILVKYSDGTIEEAK